MATYTVTFEKRADDIWLASIAELQVTASGDDFRAAYRGAKLLALRKLAARLEHDDAVNDMATDEIRFWPELHDEAGAQDDARDTQKQERIDVPLPADEAILEREAPQTDDLIDWADGYPRPPAK